MSSTSIEEAAAAEAAAPSRDLARQQGSRLFRFLKFSHCEEARVAEFQAMVASWTDKQPDYLYHGWADNCKVVAGTDVWQSGIISVSPWGNCRMRFSAEYSREDKAEHKKEMSTHTVTVYGHAVRMENSPYFKKEMEAYNRIPIYQLCWKSYAKPYRRTFQGTANAFYATSEGLETVLEPLRTNSDVCVEAALEVFGEHFEAILAATHKNLNLTTLHMWRGD